MSESLQDMGNQLIAAGAIVLRRDARSALDEQDYNMAVRRAQEAVELALKGDIPGGTDNNENRNADFADDADFRRLNPCESLHPCNPCPYFHIRSAEDAGRRLSQSSRSGPRILATSASEAEWSDIGNTRTNRRSITTPRRRSDWQSDRSFQQWASSQSF